MPYRNVVEPADLAMLTEVVDGYCRAHGIDDEDGRHRVAIDVVRLYQDGVSEARDIAARLLRPAA